MQLNAGSGILESYQANTHCADVKGSLKKANIVADNEEPLREEADEAVQEESLGEGVCESCALHTKML